MKNKDIREYAIKCKVPLWKIAQELGIYDSTFSKKLRMEFSKEQKEAIIQIINKIVMEEQ